MHGPYDPARGHRCNPAKLLLDPYAKAVDGQADGHESLLGYRLRRPAAARTARTARPHTMLSVVADPFFDWGDDRAAEAAVPRVGDVRGACARYDQAAPGAAAANCGGRTRGWRIPEVVGHLTGLGVTAVELMPVHQFVQDGHLLDRGLTNYWGYNTIGFFAPHNGYASTGGRGGQVAEFKSMVKALHAAGIEVILDVVYNHTAEGNHMGPTLSFRGHRQRLVLPAGRRRPGVRTSTPPAPATRC